MRGIEPNSGKQMSGMHNVVFLGLVSFFADVSSEMVYPLIPLYLTATLGATPALVGVIEGITESLASLLKVFSGYLSDRYAHKKRLAFCGYAMGVFYKFALLLSSSWLGILAARVIDRFGKGIRTAPRDAMVAESAPANGAGRAFGLHKALDMAGSALGILLAFVLMRTLAAGEYRYVFLLSLLPIAFALGVFVLIREPTAVQQAKTREPFWLQLGQLDRQLKLYLAVTFLFTLGNSSNAFLLLRACDTGYASANAVLLYFLYNVTASLLSFPLGRLSDRIGRKALLVTGYLVFALVYILFAFPVSRLGIALTFALYGVYTAATAGVERAFIAEIAPPALRGTMLGLHATLAGVALLPASMIAGLLWVSVGAFAPFLFGAALSLLAALLLLFGLRTGKTRMNVVLDTEISA